jgi:hypothetical protein
MMGSRLGTKTSECCPTREGEEAYPVLRRRARDEEIGHHWCCGLSFVAFGFWPGGTAPIGPHGSSGLDLGERSFLSFYLSIFLSFYLSIFLSFYLSIFLSFYLSIFS